MEDHAHQGVLDGLLDKKPPLNPKSSIKRRRFRRCRSAPLAEFLPLDLNDNDFHPPTPSPFLKLHPSVRKIVIFLFIYLGIGALCFSLVKDQINGRKTNGILDAVYFCVVTMTTVGYGDLVPDTVLVKLLACCFVFSGMALVGLILCHGADYLVEKQQVLLVKALYIRENCSQVEILKEIESNRVMHKSFVSFGILLVLMSAGTIFLVTVEKLSFVDAFYCVCCTITTLGYGDKSFSTEAGRIFAIFWIPIGALCLAQFFLYVSELNSETKQRALVNWVLTRKMTNVDLEAADLDDDGVVGATEFIIYKLKEMGKITQDEISLIMEEFEELDVDQTGTLSVCDVGLAQLS